MINIHLFYPLLFVLVIIVTFVLARVYKDKLEIKKIFISKIKMLKLPQKLLIKLVQLRTALLMKLF